MSLKDIIPFTHIPTDEVAYSYVGGTPLGDTPFVNGNWGGFSQNPTIAGVDDSNGRWLLFRPPRGSGANYSKQTGLFWLTGALYGTVATKVYYFGYRFRLFNGNGNWTTVFTSLLNLVNPDNTSTSFITPLLVPADLAGFDISKDVEYWVDVKLDFPAAKATIWVDSIKVKEIAILNAPTVGGASGAIVFGHPNGLSVQASTYYYLYLRDIYFKEVDNADDDFRLGPQVIETVPVLSVNAPGWTTAQGTLTEVLNTPIGTVASKSTPVVTSDAAQHAAQIQYQSSGLVTPINGAVFMSGGYRQPGAAGTVNASLQQGGQTQALASASLDTTISLGKKLGVIEHDLNGDRLTNAALAELVLKLQPSN